MKILILEDMPDRIRSFKQSTIGHVATIVSTVPECLELLKTESWDMLSLDHDLGGKVMVPSGPGTGWEVAEWLSKNPDRKPSRILTHSLNDKGTAEIQKILPEVELVPGVWVFSWSDLFDPDSKNYQGLSLLDRIIIKKGGSE